MTRKPRQIETAGKWRETEEGMLYAAVAKSAGETLVRADFNLIAPGPGGDGVESRPLPDPTRTEIEREIEEVVRQHAVRLLNQREGEAS